MIGNAETATGDDLARPAAVLSTDEVREHERASYWVDLICDVFVQLDCPKTSERFFGSIADQPLGDLRLSEVRSTTQHVRRTPRMLSRADDEFVLISLQTSGRGCIEQDGRQAVLQPGDFALYDSTRRYDLRFESDFSQLVLKTPRALFTDRLAGSENVTASRVDGSSGLGRVASRFIRDIAREAHTLLPHEIERVTHSAIDMMSAALGHSLLDKPISHNSTRAAQLIRIKMYIDNELSNPDLGPEMIATANGISVRYLNKLFEGEALSVCRWIWNQRLECIAKDLANPTLSSRSIGETALRWGYNNMSHFSRAFRERFGECARSYRASALKH